MQKFFAMTLAIVLSGMVVEAHAEGGVDCESISKLGATVMSARQAGVPMSKMLPLMKGNSVGEDMVIAAYETPKFSTKEYRVKAEMEFEDEWYLQCVKIAR